MSQPSRLQEKYQKKIKPQLKKELKLKNQLAIPAVKKVVINTGVKEAAQDKGVLQKVVDYMTKIVGQKPKVARATKSIAGFALRQGDPVGVTATLRGRRAFEFLDKLFTIVLPRVRDFQGVKLNAFDPHGNYTLGLEEQVVFPEIEYDKIDKVRGLEVTIVTTNQDIPGSKRLLELLGMPFEKPEE